MTFLGFLRHSDEAATLIVAPEHEAEVTGHINLRSMVNDPDFAAIRTIPTYMSMLVIQTQKGFLLNTEDFGSRMIHLGGKTSTLAMICRNGWARAH